MTSLIVQPLSIKLHNAASYSPWEPFRHINPNFMKKSLQLSMIVHHEDVLQVEYPLIEWWHAWREWHTSWYLQRVRQGMPQLTLEEHQWLKTGIEDLTWSLVRFLWPVFGKEVFWSRVRWTFGIVWSHEERRYLAYICEASWHHQLMGQISVNMLVIIVKMCLSNSLLQPLKQVAFLGPCHQLTLQIVSRCW